MKYLFSLLWIIALSGCDKNESGSSQAPNQSNTTNKIDGITETDATGNLFGLVDTTDWTTNDHFPASTVSLFNFPDTVDYSGSGSGPIAFLMYPNPCQETFNLNIYTTQITVMKFVLVDSLHHVLYNGTLPLISGNQNLYFNPADSMASDNSLFRIYYQFYDSTHAVFARGHGDIYKHL